MATTTAAAPARQRKSLPPVHGSARWLYRPGCFQCGPCYGVLLINDVRYVVTLCRADGGAVGPVLGVTLAKNDGTVYTVDFSTGECDCPDHQYRGRQCKHHKATVAALKAAGVEV